MNLLCPFSNIWINLVEYFKFVILSNIFLIFNFILKHAAVVDVPVDIYKKLSDMVLRMHVPAQGNISVMHLKCNFDVVLVVFVTVQTTLENMLKKEMNFDLENFSHWFRLKICSLKYIRYLFVFDRILIRTSLVSR